VLPQHKVKLQKLRKLEDVYSGEHWRDAILARNLGFHRSGIASHTERRWLLLD
jgi:hypothetical protein